MKRYSQIIDVSFLWLFWERQRQWYVIRGKLPKNRVRELQLNSLSLQNSENTERKIFDIYFSFWKSNNLVTSNTPPSNSSTRIAIRTATSYQIVIILEMKGNNVSASAGVPDPKLPMRGLTSVSIHLSI